MDPTSKGRRDIGKEGKGAEGGEGRVGKEGGETECVSLNFPQNNLRATHATLSSVYKSAFWNFTNVILLC